MTQTIEIAAGNTSTTSADIDVAAGEVVTVGIFSAGTGILPIGVAFIVEQVTPGTANIIARLSQQRRATVLAGPGTYRIRRPAYDGDAFGAFSDR